MTDVNLELAELKEELEEVRWQRNKSIADAEDLRDAWQTADAECTEKGEQIETLTQQVQTLKLALQACQQRIQMYDSVLASLRLTLHGLDSAIKGQP